MLDNSKYDPSTVPESSLPLPVLLESTIATRQLADVVDLAWLDQQVSSWYLFRIHMLFIENL